MPTTDRIEREVFVKVASSRVWRAIANAEEFGAWFAVKLQGQRFAVGAQTRGHVTYPGYEHLWFDVQVARVEPEHLLAFRWHPSPIDAQVDYSAEPTTLVEFTLEAVEGGTLVRIVESGFDALPPQRRQFAFGSNSEGWDAQLVNLQRYLAEA